MYKFNRKPTSPGEILKEEFLIPLNITQIKLANHIGCDVKVINRIINMKTSITPYIAMKFGAAFRTTPEFWLNAQMATDIYNASKRLEKLPKPLLKVG